MPYGRESLWDTTRAGLREAVLTPPFVFVAGCLCAPALLQLVGAPMDVPLGAPYLLAWPVLLFGGVLVATVAATFADLRGPNGTGTRPRRAGEMASDWDPWVAAWYLTNGFFFNSMMDVFAGQFQSWQTMTQRYNELEPRYSPDVQKGYDGVTVFLTSWQEILLQAPLGLLLFYGYWRGRAWRYPVEIVFNAWSIAGVWYFYGSEFVLNFPYIHAPFSKQNGAFQLDEAFTFETIYKFWIGFVIFPGLWAVVGIVLTVRAVRTISNHVEISEQHYKYGKYYRTVAPDQQKKTPPPKKKSNTKKKSPARRRASSRGRA